MKGLPYLPLLLMACTACQRTARSDDSRPVEASVATVAATTVSETADIPSADTSYAFTCNGKVSAARYADLNFRTSGLVTAVYKRNGDHVAAGEKIAQLETLEQEKALRQSETSLQQAALEMQDILIGQGFDPEKKDQVPAEMMRLIRIKSGYEQAELNLQAARIALQEATLKAPFSGVIANLTALPHNQVPSASGPVCRLIDENSLEVEFKVQENELSSIAKGDEVDILLYGGVDHSVTAHVSEVNPLVEEDGSVKIKARVGQDSHLLAGMNVQVRIKRKP